MKHNSSVRLFCQLIGRIAVVIRKSSQYSPLNDFGNLIILCRSFACKLSYSQTPPVCNIQTRLPHGFTTSCGKIIDNNIFIIDKLITTSSQSFLHEHTFCDKLSTNQFHSRSCDQTNFIKNSHYFFLYA